MGCYYEPTSILKSVAPSQSIVRPSTLQSTSSWLEMKVFYVRISNFDVNESTPENLTLNYIPMNPETLLQVNGGRRIYSEAVALLLRRNRIDKKLDEVTYVCTDSVGMSGTIKFQVYDKDNLLLTGVLELCKSSNHNSNGEPRSSNKHWSLYCEPVVTACTGFFRGKRLRNSGLALPAVDVYVAGCFSGTPIILSKIVQLRFSRKQKKDGFLDSVPEFKYSESKEEETTHECALQLSNFQGYKEETDDEDYNYNTLGASAAYMGSDNGELSWFNAGVRVGIGISLGICIGVGLGVGLLVRTYHVTTLALKKRLQ